jgi:hypothetical protein
MGFAFKKSWNSETGLHVLDSTNLWMGKTFIYIVAQPTSFDGGTYIWHLHTLIIYLLLFL